MRKLFTLLFLSLLSLPSVAQSWREITSLPDVYLFGDGYGDTLEEADNQALSALISQISVAVSNTYDETSREKHSNGQIDSKTLIDNKIQTYSTATLSNTMRLVLSNEPEAHVGRYIKRSELERIFEGRLLKVKEYIGLAETAEASLRLDDALRYYYWALLLVNSTVYPNEFKCTDKKGAQIHPVTWIPDRMNEIFCGIKCDVASRNATDAVLHFSYNGKPVASLDYTYFDGRDWSNIYSARNGVGVLEFYKGFSLENLNLKYEYVFRGEAVNLDKDVASVQNSLKSQSMKKAWVNVPLKSTSSSPQTSPIKTNPLVEASVDAGLTHVADEQKYATVMKDISNAISTRQYESVHKHFTDEGWDMYLKLVTYGSAKLVGNTECQFYKLEDKVIARSIPMSFSFKSGARKSFVEDVVFTFNAKGKVECLAFSLSKDAVNDVLGKTKWPEKARQNIIMFLENYKTAYALKRLDYIESIFDDNAVIIVGHVTKNINMRRVRNGRDQLPSYVNHPIVNKTRYSKGQYLKNLAACFANNEYVNIRFGNNQIIKAGNGKEIYGIQIKQDYFSSSYGDQGYLFLRVDLSDPDEPIISVRTWQPQPDPIDGLYNLGDF